MNNIIEKNVTEESHGLDLDSVGMQISLGLSKTLCEVEMRLKEANNLNDDLSSQLEVYSNLEDRLRYQIEEKHLYEKKGYYLFSDIQEFIVPLERVSWRKIIVFDTKHESDFELEEAEYEISRLFDYFAKPGISPETNLQPFVLVLLCSDRNGLIKIIVLEAHEYDDDEEEVCVLSQFSNQFSGSEMGNNFVVNEPSYYIGRYDAIEMVSNLQKENELYFCPLNSKVLYKDLKSAMDAPHKVRKNKM